MKHTEFLTALLGQTLNVPAEKVTSLFANEEGTELKPEALTEILELNTKKVAGFKAENQTYFDNGMKKATKEVLSDREKEIKEKYGVTSDKVGLELIDEIISAKSVKSKDMDPDKVKSSPEYIKLQDEMTNKVKAIETEWKEKLDLKEKEYADEKTFSIVDKKADEILAGFALPEDQKLRANQRKLIVDELKKYKYQDNNGEFVILDENGKVLEDGHGNRVNFKTFVENGAGKYWPKLEGEKRSGSGGNNNASGNGQQNNGWTGKPIKTEEDYKRAMGEAKDGKERIAIQDEYNKNTAS